MVLIFVNDLGWNDVSYNGATQITTPNIDRLAEEGIIFSNGYVTFPVCAPSRAGRLTGRYPSRFGVAANMAYMPFDKHLGMPLEETTFPTHLQAEGYHTGIVGKWQLGAAQHFNPLQRGFDYFYGFLGGGHDYWKIDASNPADSYSIPLAEDRNTASFAGYLTDALTDKAIEYIGREREADQPFFLYLAYNAPHGPLQAPEELVQKYQAIENANRRTYLAMMDSLDQNVGRVLDALDDSGLRQDTIVSFVNDNGAHADHWGDNGPLRGGKGRFYEGGIRVPFLASWAARWPQGETYEPMVSTLDISATVLAMAGATVTDGTRPLDGVDLDPLLRGEEDGHPHEALFWRDSLSGEYAVRSGNMKLVQDEERATPILINLDRDIGERTNLLGSQKETARELAGLWNAWNRDKYAASKRTFAEVVPAMQVVIE